MHIAHPFDIIFPNDFTAISSILVATATALSFVCYLFVISWLETILKSHIDFVNPMIL